MTTRTLLQALQAFGLTYEELRHDLAFVWGHSFTEAEQIIANAYANGELETLIYESGY